MVWVRNAQSEKSVPQERYDVTLVMAAVRGERVAPEAGCRSRSSRVGSRAVAFSQSMASALSGAVAMRRILVKVFAPLPVLMKLTVAAASTPA
jgi:hypothetical protein